MLNYFLLFLLCNSCLSAHSLIKLEELYQIQETILINYQGLRYPKIAFSDPLHEELCFVLKDPEQAKIIHQAYLDHILPHLPGELEHPFSRSLIKVCVLFGSNQFSPINALLAAFKEEDVNSVWVKNHSENIKDFVYQANIAARCHRFQKNEVFTVVILTTTASGGNHSVARAIESFLDCSTNFRSIVIDVESLAKETDPVMLATGATTYDGIYEKYFQQDNLGMDPLIMRDVISKKLGKFIPSCLGLKLKELIRTINPDLILSTRSYTIDDISLCTLGIPFRMIHCDYDLSYYLLDLYGKIHPEMLKFWLPSFDAEMFRPLFEKTNRLDIYDAQDGKEVVLKKIALITEQPIENIQGQFEILGYPTRPEFFSIEDGESLKQLQNKWDIQSDEIPVLISMGINGVGIMEEIFDELKECSGILPIKYFFVCGKNLELKNRLISKKSDKKKIVISGLLSALEMNELMNLCPVKITKPGGAVTSEALITGTHLLIMSTHPWEEANATKIERLGLGQRLNPNQPISMQVENAILRIQNQSRPAYKNIPWQEHLLNHINLMEKK